MMSKRKSPPLMEHPQVKELLAVMEQHHTDAMKDLLDVMGYVGEVEKQLDGAVKELAAMRKQLADMKQGPMKKAMQNAVITMQDKVLTLRERLEALKDSVVEGCKNLLTAFKEKGVQALSNAARFFKLRPALESMRDGLNESIKANDRTIAKIEAVSAEYHEAGRHIKNAGRALVGKEAVAEAKAPGRLAKAVSAPFRAERASLLSARKSVENALERLAHLEKSAQRRPSIRKTMQHYQDKIDQAQKSAPGRDTRRDER